MLESDQQAPVVTCSVLLHLITNVQITTEDPNLKPVIKSSCFEILVFFLFLKATINKPLKKKNSF